VAYLFGRYLVMRQERIDLAEDGVDYNVLKHNPAVVVGSDAGAAPTFVNPNLDVVYSEGWIAVDASTPAILGIPAVPAGRYYTAQIVDEWAEITHNINERNFPEHPDGRYAICLAGSAPEIPDHAHVAGAPAGGAGTHRWTPRSSDLVGLGWPPRPASCVASCTGAHP
jgi:hypothetical protein